MSLPYLNADQIAETIEFLRNGGDINRAAGHHGMTVEELNQLLGRPQWKQIPTNDLDGDLWAVDRLAAQL